MRLRTLIGAALVAAVALPVAAEGATTSTTSTSVPSSTTTTSAPSAIYVAMGDSYSSGQGNAPYTDATSFTLLGPAGAAPITQRSFGISSTNGCARSALVAGAYPNLVARALSLGTFTDVACSGATTASLSQTYHGEPAQLHAVTPDVTLVTLGEGGADDPGILTLAQACLRVLVTTRRHSTNLVYRTPNLAPGVNCAKAFTEKEALLASSEEASLLALYERILTQMAPSGHLVVVPFPVPAPLGRAPACLLTGTFPVARTKWGQALGLSASDYAGFRTVLHDLDAAMATAVTAADAAFPGRVTLAATQGLGHWLNCTPWSAPETSSGIRHVDLLAAGRPPASGSTLLGACRLARRVLPTSRYGACVALAWSGALVAAALKGTQIASWGSLHPTMRGQGALATAVIAAIASLR